MKDTPIVAARDVDLSFMDNVKPAKLRRGVKITENRPERWIDLITAFDIETTRIDFRVGRHEEHHSIMYIWQWQIDEYVTVIGRTWDEFKEFWTRLNTILEARDLDCIVYVHNLSYEFQFLWEILDLANTAKIFATSMRDVLYFRRDRLTFRCSERLANDSLRHWCKTLKTDHQKLEMSYTEKRFPWTELSDDVLAYCVNDVVCLVEAIKKQLEMHGDNLYSIPYTSTGYIRKLLRREMYYFKYAVQEQTNDLYIYRMLRLAFRGGNTHAGNSLAGIPLYDVVSWDRSSSYPDVIVHRQFPMTRFKPEPPTFAALEKNIKSGRACLVKLRLRDLQAKPGNTCPYISYSTCARYGLLKPYNTACDNGRVLSADIIEMVITDIDYKIICKTYDWNKEDSKVIELYSARYGYLPKPIRDMCIYLYQRKTELKGSGTDEIEYLRSKNLINAIYGCMVQRAISPPVYINEKGFWDYKPGYDEQAEYEKYKEKTFLNYAWGVFVCAHARAELQAGIEIAGYQNFVYCDTDSVKCLGDPDFTAYNQRKIKEAKESGAYAIDHDGNIHYMGVFEKEYTASEFVTLGAKRYAAVHPDNNGNLELYLTISGVDKRKGAYELKQKGGISAFRDGIVFQDSGHIAAFHNDRPRKTLHIDGHDLRLTSNVALVDTPYTLKIEKDYKDVLKKILIAHMRDKQKDLPLVLFDLDEQLDFGL